jgi:serine/threonine protein kinase
MALDVGTRLGTYEITGALGAGGMGEVYRATDTKLGRDVAIKALPMAFAKDTDRLSLRSSSVSHVVAGFDRPKARRRLRASGASRSSESIFAPAAVGVG